MLNRAGGLVALGILALSSKAFAGDFEIHPSIAVGEEYTDNVFETRTDRLSDYITHALPGVEMNYKSPALTGDLNYQLDYRHYARKTRDDDFGHNLLAKAHLVAVDNLLFLDVSEEFQRVSLDVARDVTRESLFLNQSDRNKAMASPYVLFHPSQKNTVKAGYRFTGYHYSDNSAVDKMDHAGFLEFSHELSQRWSLTAGYNFTKEYSDANNFSQHQGFGGFRYEYFEKSYLFAQAGNTWTNYDNSRHLNNLFWNVGFSHAFDTIALNAATGVRYDEDPLGNITQETFVSAGVEKRLKSGLVSLSPYYSEYVLTQTDILDTKKYGVIVNSQYELTSRLNAKISFTAEKYEQPLLGSYTRRFLVDSQLSYLLAEKLTILLSYIYVDYYSPGIAEDNRHINRGIIEIRKTF